MKFTNEQKRIVLKGYQKASSSTDLNQAVYSNNGDLIHRMFKDALIQRGFPKNVDLRKIEGKKINVTVTDFEFYIHRLETSGKVEDNTFETIANNNNFYVRDILEDLSGTNVEMNWKTQLEEYQKENEESEGGISVKELQRIIELKYSREILEEHLRENEYFTEVILEDKAKDEGFINTKIAKNHFSFRNLQLKYPASTLAELYIEIVNSKYVNALDFMRKDFYQHIVREKLYIVDVQFDIDPSEEEIY